MKPATLSPHANQHHTTSHTPLHHISLHSCHHETSPSFQTLFLPSSLSLDPLYLKLVSLSLSPFLFITSVNHYCQPTYHHHQQQHYCSVGSKISQASDYFHKHLKLHYTIDFMFLILISSIIRTTTSHHGHPYTHHMVPKKKKFGEG